MKKTQRLILITTPADAPACRAALAAALGRGWDTPGVLTPWPPDPTPAIKATPTAYLLDAGVTEEQAARLVEVAAGSPDRTLRRARLLGEEDRDGAIVSGERLTLREAIAAHETTKAALAAEGEKK